MEQEEEETLMCLRWNNFKDTVLTYYELLRDEEEYVDVTLSCGGKTVKAHQVILAASSPYLRALLEDNPCRHPYIILDDMPISHLEALVSFVYTGKVSVGEEDLSAFLESANVLRIRGLSDVALDRPPQMIDEASTEDSNEKALSEPLSSNTPSSCSSLSSTESTPRRSSETLQISPLVKIKKEKSDEEVDKIKADPEPTTSASVPPPSMVPVPPLYKPDRQYLRRMDYPERGYYPGDPMRRSVEFRPPVIPEGGLLQGKRSVPPEFGNGPIIPKRGPIPGRRGGAAPLFPSKPEVKMDEQSTNGMTEAEMMAMGGPPPGPYFQQMQFTWQKEDSEMSQGDVRRRHSLDPRPCPVCNRVYSNLSNLRQHLRLIHNPKFVTCHLCSKTFKTDLYLRRHIMSYHELNTNHETGMQEAAPIPLSVVEVKSYEPNPSNYCLPDSALNSGNIMDSGGNFNNMLDSSINNYNNMRESPLDSYNIKEESHMNSFQIKQEPVMHNLNSVLEVSESVAN